MFDFLDEMYHKDASEVNEDSNSLNHTLDQVRRRARSGKLTEKFLTPQDQVPIKRRPSYLTRAIEKSKRQIRYYARVCKQLALARRAGRRQGKATPIQSNQKKRTLASS